MAKPTDEQANPATAVAENGMAVLRLLASQRPRELFTGFQKQLLGQISQAMGQAEPRRRAILERVYRALSAMPNQLLQDIYHYLHSALDQFANNCLVSSDAALRANVSSESTPLENKSLSLVSPELSEEQALITSLRQRADSRYQELLWALNKQMAQISGGSAYPDGNPLAPVRFCLALRHGLDKAGVELPVKKIIYRLFDDAVLAQLEPFYQQMSDGLKVVGITAEQHFDVVKAPLHQDDPRQPPIHNSQNEFISDQPAFSTPEPLTSVPPAVDHSGDNLLQQLTTLLGNGQMVLHESHRHTIEIVDGVMAEFSRNSRLGTEVKALFSLLHMPLLKVALVDPEQFQQMNHPARQLLVDMVEAATDWLQGEQREVAVFHHIRGAVERLLRNTSVDSNAFAEERDNLRQQISQLHRKKRQQARRSGDRKYRSGARNEARGESVAAALRRRIGKQALPEAISELLHGHWTDYLKSLAIELGSECHQNSRWQDALSVVDDLLWGLQINPQNRKESQRWRQNYLWLEAVLASGLDHLSLDSGQCQRLLSAVRGEYRGLLESRRAVERASADVTPLPDKPLQEPQAQESDSAMSAEQWREKLSDIELDSWLNFASGRREQLVWRNLRTLQFEFRDPDSGKSSIRTGDDLARLLAEQTATLEPAGETAETQQTRSAKVVRGVNYIAK
ncbi:DUF1631 family protein [Porticoccus sp. W117]|uniref:DUF1631 family protein n=1 Tax=Porticoccus sp. W117 TaxID=3054777 RepID=UPI002594B5A8|nr:DUF1631 family protein [Porticoccus sp. W117]MDM3870495.1 DUF1631 family protein [Porticoccus sp. W117]